jgi:serine/threonine-protein kinase
MGQVYSARNIISGRTEAMKILLPDFAAEQDLAARFTAEIRTLASLDHPNIAQLRTAFQFENRLVMIMEFVEGVTLDKRGSEAPIPIDEVIGYSMQV